MRYFGLIVLIFYDERFAGVGAVGWVRPWDPPADAEEANLGGVGYAGPTIEYRALRERCHGDPQCVEETSFDPEMGYALRMGIGYDFPIFGFRAGMNYSDAIDGRLAEPLPFPDAALRLGYRDRATFEIGLGAYDASTSLRPGLYIGATLVPAKRITVALHGGLHANINSFGATVTQIGLRVDGRFSVALTDKLELGAGLAYQQSSLGRHTDVFEGHGHAAFSF